MIDISELHEGSYVFEWGQKPVCVFGIYAEGPGINPVGVGGRMIYTHQNDIVPIPLTEVLLSEQLGSFEAREIDGEEVKVYKLEWNRFKEVALKDDGEAFLFAPGDFRYRFRGYHNLQHFLPKNATVPDFSKLFECRTYD